MYKLVVSDVDGTLLNSDHQLLDETKEYLISLKKQNILFTLASGRHNDLMKLKPIMLKLNFAFARSLETHF